MDPLSLIGAIGAITSLAGAGAKLSMFLFDVSRQIGSAGDEVRDLGIDISLFCAVLKQLQKVLDDERVEKKRTDGGVAGDGNRSETGVIERKKGSSGQRGRGQRRQGSVSQSAIETTQQILDRCRAIFGKIEAAIRSLNVDTTKWDAGTTAAAAAEGNGSGNGGSTLDMAARIRWALKRNRIKTYKATLESCKITLTLMVNTLTYADVISARRSSNKETEVEDDEEEVLSRSLASAQIRANERLASLEEEDEKSTPMSEGDIDTVPAPPPAYEASSSMSAVHGSVSSNDYVGAPVPPTGATPLKSVDDSVRRQSSLQQPGAERLLSTVSWDLPIQRPSEQRASVWLNRLLLDDISTAPSSRQSSVISTDSAAATARHPQLGQLLFKWTDQGHHWASLHDQPYAATTGSVSGIVREGAPSSLKGLSFEQASVQRQYTAPISPGSKPNTEPMRGILGFDGH